MPKLTPAAWTFTFSIVLAATATAVTALAGHPPILATHVPEAVAAPALALLFAFGELFLMNVEFRRQAHSFTLAGVPLLLGVLTLSPIPLILARLVGSLLAFAYQRISLQKMFYNCAAYAFEAAVDVAALHLLLGRITTFDPMTGLLIVVVIACVDQLMCLFVLALIRLHNGRMSRADALEVLAPAVVLSLVATAFGTAVILLAQRGAVGLGIVLVLAIVATAGYRAHAATRRRHQALTLVHEFVAGGVGAPSLEVLARELLSRIRQLLRSATAELTLLDADSSVRGSDRPDSAPARLILTVDEDDQLSIVSRPPGATDWVLQRAMSEEAPLLASRTTKDAALRRWLAARGSRDAVVVALPAGNGLVGTLAVTDRLGETATFTDDDVTLLQTLAAHLAIAVRSTRLVEKLSYDATHDSLTGLANRAHLTARINETLHSPRRNSAVMLLDLDRFKEVNDILGHEVGDRLLTVVGDRLAHCLPETAVVARLGGDEFAVLLSDVPDPALVAVLAEDVADVIAQPVLFEEAMLTPEVSIGVAITTRECPQRELLRHADTAMYEAKSKDQRVALYVPEMDQGRSERLALLADLRLALASTPEQFVLHYQPKIDLTSGTITGAEALVRWYHPTLGIVAPDRFIPLAESTGLIEKLTPLVLDSAVKECASWTGAAAALNVAVNLSARNITDPSLPARVAASLRNAGLPAERLILEITESSVMSDDEQTMPTLQALHDLGICLSLDDFGTGYSSLSYLHRLPVNEVKIDRSFVLGLTSPKCAASRALITGITGLSKSLGLRIVAEGIEDQHTLDTLLKLGCDIGQGYYLGRPLPPTEFRHWTELHRQHQEPAVRLVHTR